MGISTKSPENLQRIFFNKQLMALSKLKAGKIGQTSVSIHWEMELPNNTITFYRLLCKSSFEENMITYFCYCINIYFNNILFYNNYSCFNNFGLSKFQFINILVYQNFCLTKCWCNKIRKIFDPRNLCCAKLG